jgi:hypothetical protein
VKVEEILRCFDPDKPCAAAPVSTVAAALAATAIATARNRFTQ